MIFLTINTDTRFYIINISKILLMYEEDGKTIIEFDGRFGNPLRVDGIKQSLQEIAELMN